MGVDWIRRAEEKFRHSLQQATSGITPAGLFAPEEEISVTYPCHWLHEDCTFPVGTALIVFQRSEQARVAVLYGTEAVAEIRGEAARDLKELFRRHPEMANALAVIIVKVGAPAEPFYVQPATKAKKRSTAQ